MMNDETKILKRPEDMKARTYRFALRIIKLAQSLPYNQTTKIISSQIIRSGTSVGSNMEEAHAGLSKKDFIHSLNIARKEARETKYWINLIIDAGFVKKEKLSSLVVENDEIISILTAIVKKHQHRNGDEKS